MRKKDLGALLGACSLFAIAPTAIADFNVGDILDFDDGTNAVAGTIEFVDIVTGVPGGDVTIFDMPGAMDTTLVFRISVDVGEISEFGIGITDGFDSPLNSTGAGWIQDSDPNQYADISGLDGTLDTRIFMFDPPGGLGGNQNDMLDAGEASDLIFVSYASLALDGSETLAFMITDSVPTFSVKIGLGGIPAPGILAAFGAAGLLLGGRRRRRSSAPRRQKGSSRKMRPTNIALIALAAGALSLATGVPASAQDDGLVYEGTSEIVHDNGLYTVIKDVRVCFDPTCDGQSDDCCADGKPVQITMLYTGDDCSATQHSQNPDKVNCEDFGALLGEVFIRATNKEDPFDGSDDVFHEGRVNIGEEYVIDAENAGATNPSGHNGFGSSGNPFGIDNNARNGSLGGNVVASGVHLPSKTFIHIFDDEDGTLLQSVEFHTSCSQPLFIGNQFGASQVVSCIGEDEAVEGDCCANGKPVRLTMQYTGDDCSATQHGQNPDKVSCDDFGALGGTVFIRASDKEDPNAGDAKVWFEGDVNLDDEYVIDAEAAGESKLKAKTYLHLYDMEGGTLLQQVEFHTSCSQPLFLGNQFGASLLVDCEGENGGIDPPVDPCDPFPNDGLFTYTYKLTNSDYSMIGLIGFEILVDGSAVVDAGYLEGDGVVPSAVNVSNGRVRWNFFGPMIMPGEMSVTLYITSPLGPDVVGASILGQAALDQPHGCVGPVVECEFCEGSDQCFSCPEGLAMGPPCPEPQVSCCDDGKPRLLLMRYTGNDCDDSANDQGDKFKCKQSGGALPATAYLVASQDSDCSTDVYFSGEVTIGDEYVIDAGVLGESKLKAKTYICILDGPGGTVLQHVEMHTSCSAPLFIGDGFGGSTVVDCEPEL